MKQDRVSLGIFFLALFYFVFLAAIVGFYQVFICLDFSSCSFLTTLVSIPFIAAFGWIGWAATFPISKFLQEFVERFFEVFDLVEKNRSDKAFIVSLFLMLLGFFFFERLISFFEIFFLKL